MVKMGRIASCLMVFTAAGFILSLNLAAGLENDAKRTYSIKDVMLTAYKNKLASRIIRGEATAAEKERLLTLYTALAATAPPRGSKISWQRKTNALVKAAQAAIEGEEEAPRLLKKTMECGACHSLHK